MTTLWKLKRQHKYKYFGTPAKHCHNCKHFKHEEAYAGVEGMSADMCRLYRDEDEGGVIILQADHGVCDEHT